MKSTLKIFIFFVDISNFEIFNPCKATKLDSEREQAQLQAEQDRKEIEKLVRDRDLLNKNLRKAGEQTQKQLSLVRLHEQQKVNLEQEITQFRDEAAKQRKIIYQLEKERDRSELRNYFWSVLILANQ